MLYFVQYSLVSVSYLSFEGVQSVTLNDSIVWMAM